MLEVLFTVGFLPVFDGVCSQAQYLVHALKPWEVIKYSHNGDIANLVDLLLTFFRLLSSNV